MNSSAKTLDEKFTTAWINIGRLPGSMMISTGPEGTHRYGPVATTTGCLITTSPTVVEEWRQQGKPVLEVALSGDSTAQETVDRLVNERIAGGVSRSFTPETSCELERLRELQEKALALDDAVAEFGIDKPQYIAEAYQQFHDVLHDGHGSPSAVETAAPETSHDLFEATAMLADPNTMRIDIRFQNRADYEAAVVFFGMADSPEETAASVRDSIAPNIHCPVCDRWYWADKFDGHKCVAQKASACACRCHSSAGPNEGACIYCGHLPVNGKGDEQ